MPCALSSALVMWGCRGLGLNGAMVPLVLCADSMCARRSSPCTVPGGEGLIDGGYSFKEPVAAVAGIILNPDKEWRALATEIEILKEQVPAEFAFPFPSLSRPSIGTGFTKSNTTASVWWCGGTLAAVLRSPKERDRQLRAASFIVPRQRAAITARPRWRKSGIFRISRRFGAAP